VWGVGVSLAFLIDSRFGFQNKDKRGKKKKGREEQGTILERGGRREAAEFFPLP
jgi:hypothetical protein